MEKILFLVQASKADPGFEDVSIDGKFYKYYLKDKGIHAFDPVVIESCHGCPDLVADYSKQLQGLAEEGHRIVEVAQGGLYFALPGIQATQVTFPIISVPLDLIAYQGFVLPSGHAAIATVGVERKITEHFETQQRSKAIRLAERILNLEELSPHVSKNQGNSEVVEELSRLNIPITHVYGGQHLSLTYGEHIDYAHIILCNVAGILNINDRASIEEGEMMQHYKSSRNLLQVYGSKNQAIFAAKIMSLQRPELIEAIKKIGADKRGTYSARNLADELQVRR